MGTVLLCVVVAGCVREPEQAVCPDIGEGDLVVTEIGGEQTGMDTLKPWIEVYNASGASIDLLGVKVRFRRVNASSENAIVVRREVPVAANAYFVLGLDLDDDRAAYIDYGFAADYHESWLSTAAVEVEACGTRIDLARYDMLPSTGTWSLGVPPDATQNDYDTWCTDTTINVGSFPGTPQRANNACP